MLAIYGICVALAVLALILTGATQLYAFLGVFMASGLVLFLPTRGGFRRPDELEAESYETDEPHVPAPGTMIADPDATEPRHEAV